MAYRSDIDALAARDEVLARELADKQRERAAVQQLLEEARAAERAQQLEHDVMVGRRTLRRARFVTALLVAAGAAAGAVSITRPGVCSKPTQDIQLEYGGIDESLFDRGLAIVALEPRFLSPIGYPSIAELDEALGGPFPAWEMFTYTRDASGRTAIASEPYRLGGTEPDATFVSDGHGGLWRLTPHEPFVSTGNGAWTRRIWLIPLGSAFRGPIDIATE